MIRYRVPNTSPTSSGPSSASRAVSVRRRFLAFLRALGEEGVHVDSSSIPALVGSSDAPGRVMSESKISGASGSMARAARPAPAIPSAPSTPAPPDARAGASVESAGPVGLSNHLTASACLGSATDGAGPTGPFRKPVARSGRRSAPHPEQRSIARDKATPQRGQNMW